jgi:amino acid transporter
VADEPLTRAPRPAFPGGGGGGRTSTSYDLVQRELIGGSRPGARYVRIEQPFATEFRRRAPGHLVATEEALAPRGRVGTVFGAARRVMIGSRIATDQEIHERIGRLKGLAVFASDNISSSAYASEEIMRVLALAGAGALALTMPITIGIVAVLALVVLSYQQTVRAYPNGGGSYIVASDNLGRIAGLVAAGALLTDYVLTVAVSIAAGVAALTSLFPWLFDARVALGVGFVLALCLGNLRGTRESATIFSIPTYVYLVSIYGLLAFGLVRAVTGTLPVYHPPPGVALGAPAALGLVLLLRAFASGSVALTGTEAISNGVPAFRPPEWRNARTVLLLMGTFFGTIFLGISYLAGRMGIVPDPTEQETVISQITRTLVGAGTPYHYLIQISTALLLVLAANTAFADFPRLSSILGKDRFLPRQFQFRGDRLAFSVGVLVLALLASLLIVAFGGSVTNLIPLYTVGVFVAFTLSQAGMVLHWWRLRGEMRGWRWRAAMNGTGCLVTGLVAAIVGSAKFALGAWMVLVLIPMLIGLMWAIHRHYAGLEVALEVRPPVPILASVQPSPRVLVPLSRMDQPAIRAITYARSISPDVTAVHVTDDHDEAVRMKDDWGRWSSDVNLVVVESPYRALTAPLLRFIDAVERTEPARPVTVVLAELVPRHLWEYPLHNQTALRLKLRLFFRPNTVVVDVPYHLDPHRI